VKLLAMATTTWLDQCVVVAKHVLMQMVDTHATDFVIG
jgi:hypothetical protein